MPSETRGPRGSGRGLVLLVEDNEDSRNVYRTILEHVGYEVLEAVNGQIGIVLARERMPDIILMDVSLPVVDGWTATAVLKADPITRSIPIIALTAHALAEDEERSRAAGCDGYLAKPVAPRDVVAEIRRWIEPPTSEAE